MASRRKKKFSTELEKEFPMFIKSKLDGEIECLTCGNAKINIVNEAYQNVFRCLKSFHWRIRLKVIGLPPSKLRWPTIQWDTTLATTSRLFESISNKIIRRFKDCTESSMRKNQNTSHCWQCIGPLFSWSGPSRFGWRCQLCWSIDRRK